MQKAQSTLEYAVVIVCICGALLAMQTYLKRGMQGRLRQTADDLGSQYAPGQTESDMTLTQESEVITETVTDWVENDDGEEYLKTTTTSTIGSAYPSTESRQGTERVYADE